MNPPYPFKEELSYKERAAPERMREVLAEAGWAQDTVTTIIYVSPRDQFFLGLREVMPLS